MSLTHDRYELLHLVSVTAVPQRPDVHLWRALDTALGRTVALTVFEAHDARIPALHEVLRPLAGLDGRGLVRLLDVLEDDEHLVVVSEWVDGSTLSDLYEARDGEPLGVERGLQIARRVAEALAAAHAVGVHHQHVRPASILITPTGDVLLRGVGIDAAVWGAVPDPVSADLHGIGSLLYAATTARWPGGLAGGLPAAPRTPGGLVLLPSQVSADVPAALDRVVARCLTDVVPLRGAPAFTCASEVAMALTVTQSRVRVPAAAGPRRPRADRPRRTDRATRRRVARGVLAGAAGVAVIGGGLALTGLFALRAAPSPWGSAEAPDAGAIFTATAAATQTGGVTAFLEPAGVQVLSPEGPQTGAEDAPAADSDPGVTTGLGGLPSDAVDGNDLTAWLTPVYYSATLDGDPGIGLVLDLGGPQAVSAVDLRFIGSPTSVDVRLAATVLPEPDDWTTFAAAAGVGEQITLRAPRPAIGRYVLLWMTSVPRAAAGYQGGIAEVRVS